MNYRVLQFYKLVGAGTPTIGVKENMTLKTNGLLRFTAL